MSLKVGGPDADDQGTPSDVEGPDSDVGATITNVDATRKHGE